ncbi:hypothetical protein H0H93_010189 [Arthromyces matolae]|nr:hypothetical protein H0H93_010189 [Arthromyces matolae]
MPQPARRPRIWVRPEPPTSLPFQFFGRPILRWITWAAISLFGISLVLTFIRDNEHEHEHIHMHIPPPHPWGQRPPPPPPWMRPHIDLPPPEAIKSDPKWASRAEKVKEAFVHAYEGYRNHALPFDELKPISGRGNNKLSIIDPELSQHFSSGLNGWGLTLFDALDTMWIMRLTDTFNDALEFVAHSTFISPNPRERFAPFFETVIRYLGGMLSAYSLSGETVILARADDLASMLLPAFNSTSGFPYYAVDPQKGEARPGWNGRNVLWAEALSNQLEYKYLAHLTGRAEYFHKTEHVMRQMYDVPTNGKFPTMWDIETGRPSNDQFSVGAFADSAHEYLLKQWLLTGQSEPKIRELYTVKSEPSHTFEHLSCFLPGLLALGAHTLDLPRKEREIHTFAAEGLARTCWATYLDMETGLGADEVLMQPGTWGNDRYGLWSKHLKRWESGGRLGIPPGLGDVKKASAVEREYIIKKSSFLLRPETLESFYVLWKTTGQEVWRERGWMIFEAIEKHARTEHGYANIAHVDMSAPSQVDEMPSGEDPLPFDQWVFNTEAHPLPIFKWRDWEKKKYGIP